jgi:hypothetical protein
MRPMVCRPGRCLRNGNLEGNVNVFAFFEGRRMNERVNLPLSAGNKKVKTESGLNFASNIVRIDLN